MSNNYTTLEQSEKLLKLGLSSETADMYYFCDPTPVGNVMIPTIIIIEKYLHSRLPEYNRGDVPCWSLSALLSLMPKKIQEVKDHDVELNLGYLENKCNVGYFDWTGLQHGPNFTDDSPLAAAYSMVVWLLEHGYIKTEQNPTDKVEPKFKVGNWYQCTKDFFGKGVTFDKNTAYYCAQEECLQNEYGCHIAIVKDLYDNFKLWTIQDAKDGDVLAKKDIVFIFKHMDKTGLSLCRSYCEVVGNSKLGLGFDFSINDVQPATKEQRDLLFSKMKEAGYEWNADKKELRKIEHKPTWSEDDEKMFSGLNSIVEDWHNTMSEQEKEYYGDCGYIEWLKSLKERMGGE